ncbi:hypothetical protein CC85DRAFT_2216 [Cutaneotrichosporon oleaginosum]|uniref:Uncharacterized protein n=1 Tax=Cutaneotrichosporon oleaginosum TaxID=879819 RepID=A0A0J0XZG6_9TREE|nr:uncharacterized protein CC85DRAFT_2216 [Cutaneotrichosporon oleaginosum]KLT46433.1 hypothetical protein CC85DRAFT_2216 [Cutaneotrichosporon oleaginosum]TXT15197.1 hypothetical protein COLE_01390 [Cutaneotrichosporon oleaginosum]
MLPTTHTLIPTMPGHHPAGRQFHRHVGMSRVSSTHGAPHAPQSVTIAPCHCHCHCRCPCHLRARVTQKRSPTIPTRSRTQDACTRRFLYPIPALRWPDMPTAQPHILPTRLSVSRRRVSPFCRLCQLLLRANRRDRAVVYEGHAARSVARLVAPDT